MDPVLIWAEAELLAWGIGDRRFLIPRRVSSGYWNFNCLRAHWLQKRHASQSNVEIIDGGANISEHKVGFQMSPRAVTWREASNYVPRQ